jgi:hypothetical protein
MARLRAAAAAGKAQRAWAQPSDQLEAVGGGLLATGDSLDRHQAQADLDGFVHAPDRLRGQTPLDIVPPAACL